MPAVAPYGSWESPVTPESVAAAAVSVSAPAGSGPDVYWLESRPAEQGRVVLARTAPGRERHDVTPPGFSVRSSVHEYGGGAYAVKGSTVVFTNWEDQRLWRQDDGGPPRPITSAGADGEERRHADCCFSPDGSRVACVRERHGPRGVDNEIVLVDPAGGSAEAVAASGHDFFAAPRFSPDGRRIAWLSWDHPNMPWDGTDLWVADVSRSGPPGAPEHVAGGPAESVLQPRWGAGGSLWYVSDRSGWWNLYSSGRAQPVIVMDAEMASPPWTFATSNHTETAAGLLVCSWTSEGTDHLGIFDPATSCLEVVDVPYTSIESLTAQGDRALFVGASPSTAREIVAIDPRAGTVEVVRAADPVGVEAGFIALPEPIEFPTGHGDRAYGLYYPPTSPDFEGPPGDRPPLMVVSHGGPTGAARPGLNLALLFWTSRGFGVVDVNYRGSTGYGRRYRSLLEGMWGLSDAEDCAAAARHLVAAGRADPRKLVIRGSSAGGLTTLMALAGDHGFAAGAVHYGVADLEGLATDTHKFESRYLERLVGPYPERRDVYVERSPLHRIAQLSKPVIFFQGDEDRVVPIGQAESMVEAMKQRGVPVAYVVFEGEQHGFRKASSIATALRDELTFFGQVLGFSPAGGYPPVHVEGLAASRAEA